jgi:RNA polymerase sigma factor (TIGR02999 family)
MDSQQGDVTQLLKAMHAGDNSAGDRLLPLVYRELHKLAEAYMRRERPDHTLQPTALINEAYLRLGGEDVDWTGRDHFIGLAAHVMRQVLVDHARAHNAVRRAGGLRRVEMDEGIVVSPGKAGEIEWVHEALCRLAVHNKRQAQVVELRYFGGLSVEQVASALGIAPRSVKRDWSLARIWLSRELNPKNGSPPKQI